jgi:hypothetical protein
MGLDMYLTKETYVKNWDFVADKFEVIVNKNGEPMKGVDPSKIKNIEEDAGYWRKFNALHNWFVQNLQEGVDDCGKYYVSKDKVQQILSILKEIDQDNSKAEELLPTTNGFFFGGADYDEWYFKDIKYSIDIFEQVLKNIGTGSHDYYYQSSW